MVFLSRELLSQIRVIRSKKVQIKYRMNYLSNFGTHNAFYRHRDNYMSIYLIAF